LGNSPTPILHAVVSCKWNLRSDRAQNARSEALNLVRNRKGRAHLLARAGYRRHRLRLPLRPARVARRRPRQGGEDTKELLDMMIDGKRLKGIADLPLDLAV